MNRHVPSRPAHLELSFVDRSSCWSVTGTGNYTQDWDKGLTLGQEYLDHVAAHPTYGSRALLGWIVAAMFDRCKGSGKLTGLELGFMQRVNEYAMASGALLAGASSPQPVGEAA